SSHRLLVVRRAYQVWLETFAYRRSDLVALTVGVDDEIMLGIGSGELEERAAYARVEVDRLRLEPVGFVEAPEPDIGLYVEQDGQMRTQLRRRPPHDRLDLLTCEVAPGTLVRECGGDVAVGDDDLAGVESGLDDGVDVLRLVGGVQQRLRTVRQLAGLDVEQDGAKRGSDRGVARLMRVQDVVPGDAQGVGEQPRLRRLARALAAFERDEHAALAVTSARPWFGQFVSQCHPWSVVHPTICAHTDNDRDGRR